MAAARSPLRAAEAGLMASPDPRPRRRRRPRNADVLDSSDDESSSVDSSSNDQQSDASRSFATVDSLSYSAASTSLTSNIAANARLVMNNIAGAAHEGGTIISQSGVQVEDASDSSDEDDELMNPYIMNPFHSSSAGVGGMTGDAGLLPPSMELASLSGRGDGARDTSTNVNGRGSQLPQAASPPRAQTNPSLAGFDPYSPKSGAKLRQFLGGDRPPSSGLEREEEESIEFLSPSPKKGQPKPHSNGPSVFGPLVEEPPTPSAPGGARGGTFGAAREQPSFASSFSPFPKHRPAQTSGEYGEGTPLSGVASRHNGRGSGTHAPSGGIWGIAMAIADVAKAVVSTAAYALWYGHHMSAPRRGRNPFSNRPARMSHDNYRRWGTMAYFRLVAVAAAALFAVSTLTMMWHVPDSTSVMEVVNKSGYQSEGESEGGDQKTVVIQKLEAKKRHWWNRKKAQEGGGQQAVTEVYRDGQKETVEADGQQQQTQQQQQPSVEGGATGTGELPVVVQQEKDGTLLIKLPPPKSKLLEPQAQQQQQAMGSVVKPPPLGSNLPESPLGSSAEGTGEGETMYIKLPYTQQQPQLRRTLMEADRASLTKEELDPPMSGAAAPLLTRRPPPPMEEPLYRHHAHSKQKEEHHRGLLGALETEFHSWMTKHGKEYTGEEKERRFGVWKKNHDRIRKKNEQHGPCKMTGKPVFGHNLFSDLDPEEFQGRFLTGYKGPKVHEHRTKNSHGHKRTKGAYFRESRRKAKEELSPPPVAKRHPSIQRKLEEHAAQYGGSGGSSGIRLHGAKYQSSQFHGCSLWDVSCLLRWIFGYQYVGGTREPVYDEDSYPSALDWRSMGVVTDVHSQGSCGACWAITAVETIESAYAIATGQLLDLDEEEVIACDGSCEMCDGGWPQNAFEYVMKHEGLPEKQQDYDADWLYSVTATLQGESNEVSEYDIGSYMAQVCPAGYREGGEDGSGSQKSGSGDNQYQYESTYVQQTRYGKIKGYGYATDRCVCYTDGSGCDCDDQDEKTAVLNVASYGPAAVCLEASQWQYYEGGIMTSDIGCSMSFLDMNHCIEVVGYAFTDGSSNGDDGEDGNQNSKSGSGSGSGSRDNGSREGYWIVKNQWSNNWGMNGYAYVSMGENTCGILNDMTQVYMK
ncbi:hypothetical protein ACHAXT_010785 [Thalassiosira profunda]